MSTFDHSEGRLIATPLLGAPTIHVAQPFVFAAVESAAFDPGGKGSIGKQFGITPYAILKGSAEPKLTITLSDGSEAWDALLWCGGIGAKPITFSHVFTRLGLPSANFMFIGGCLVNGGGYDSSADKGVTSKIEIMCTDVRFNGKSIYT